MSPFEEAAWWCAAHGARTIWSEDERLCHVVVPVPGCREVSIMGEGEDFVAAVAAARASYRAYEDGTPTKPMRRPGHSS